MEACAWAALPPEWGRSSTAIRAVTAVQRPMTAQEAERVAAVASSQLSAVSFQRRTFAHPRDHRSNVDVLESVTFPSGTLQPVMLYGHWWNVLTLLAGLGLLIAGACRDSAPDWDIPVSCIMALFAYLTAAWSLRTVVQRQWRRFPLMLLAAWWSVDGCYASYWMLKDPHVLELMRSANWPASLALYGACGIVWSIPAFEFKRAT